MHSYSVDCVLPEGFVDLAPPVCEVSPKSHRQQDCDDNQFPESSVDLYGFLKPPIYLAFLFLDCLKSRDIGMRLMLKEGDKMAGGSS